jgi:FkbM family methyltransferase
MNASVALLRVIERLFSLGLKYPAVTLANLIFSGRSFSIDEDGHWVCAQPGATIVSPDPWALRYPVLDEGVRDEWFYRYTPGPGDIAFDVGSGIGEEAVVLAKLCRHVVAIEAHPNTFRCLQETVRRSGLSNVTPILCALADKDGELKISTRREHLANSVVAGDGDTVIPARSLQSLCRELGIGRVEFLKMNVEGAERLAVKGFGEVPIKHLAVQCHDFIGGAEYETREEVAAALSGRGYELDRRADHPRPWTRHVLYA